MPTASSWYLCMGVAHAGIGDASLGTGAPAKLTGIAPAVGTRPAHTGTGTDTGTGTGATGGGTYNYLQDGPAWIRQIETQIEGQEFELLNYYSLWYNYMVYNTSTRNWYNNMKEGYKAGYYLLSDWNNRPKAGSLTGVKVSVPTTAVSAAPAGSVAAALTAGQNIGTTGAAAGDPVVSLSNALAISVPAAGLAGIPVTLGTNVATQATNPTDGSTTMSYNRYQIPASVQNRGPNGWHYTVPLSMLGICRSKRHLPLPHMGTLKIRITLDQWANCHVSNTATGADQNYTISECKLEYDLVGLSPSLKSLFEANLAGAGVNMVFDSYNAMTANIPAGTTGPYTTGISVFKSKLKDMHFLQRSVANLQRTAVRTDTIDASNNFFVSTGMPLRVGSSLRFPNYVVGQTIAGTVTAFNNSNGEFGFEQEKAFNSWDDHNVGGVLGFNESAPIPIDDYTGNYFGIGVELETVPGNMISGIDLKSVGGLQVYLDLTFDTGGPYDNASGTELDVLLHFDKVIMFKNGQVKVED
jgi:hypothetical protein